MKKEKDYLEDILKPFLCFVIMSDEKDYLDDNMKPSNVSLFCQKTKNGLLNQETDYLEDTLKPFLCFVIVSDDKLLEINY